MLTSTAVERLTAMVATIKDSFMQHSVIQTITSGASFFTRAEAWHWVCRYAPHTSTRGVLGV